MVDGIKKLVWLFAWRLPVFFIKVGLVVGVVAGAASLFVNGLPPA